MKAVIDNQKPSMATLDIKPDRNGKMIIVNLDDDEFDVINDDELIASLSSHDAEGNDMEPKETILRA